MFDSEDVQSIRECLYPYPFSWSLINKGLLHSDFLMKHGTLKASFGGTEVAGLDSLIGALNSGSYSSNQMMQGWATLKKGIQNEVRTLNSVQACSPIVEHIECYDPVFVLLFSVHSLVIMSILNLWRLLV